MTEKTSMGIIKKGKGECRLSRETTCSFTGHRPAKLPWGKDETDPRCAALKAQIVQALERAYAHGYRHFICGMARGCDLYFAEAVLALRDRRQGVTLEAAIPCEGQANRWSEPERNRYFDLVARCDMETMVQTAYDPGCMQRRNRYMVARSGLLIAAYDGLMGGTMYTIHFAMREMVELDIIPL